VALALAVALALLPASAAAAGKPADAAPKLDADAWIVVDADDGAQLAGRAVDRSLSIASTTKLMTAYLTLRSLPLDKKVVAPGYDAAPAESIVGLQAGERLTVRDLLTAMLLPSANDAAVTLADGVAGSTRAFVAEMNRAAERLGLDDTSYANPIGLDDPLNYSSARDLTALAGRLLVDERFREIVAKQSATLESGAMPRTVTTRNTLMAADPSVDGVKTGHTIEAGYVLVASAERHGIRLISAVLGAPSEAERDEDSEQLLDYGFSQYERERPVLADDELTSAQVRYEDAPLPLVAERGVSLRARRDENVNVSFDNPTLVEGPIESGERIGTATVTLDGEVVGRTPLLAGAAVDAPDVFDKAGVPAEVALPVIAAIVILLIGLVLLRGRAGRGSDPNRTPEERARSRAERTHGRHRRGTE
jgi:D-alanyl-D-alanine carboxypeptidase (penicillin-binding protein 5/6)